MVNFKLGWSVESVYSCHDWHDMSMQQSLQQELKQRLCALFTHICGLWRVRSFNWAHRLNIIIIIYSCEWRIAKCIVWILLHFPVHFLSENFNHRLNHSKVHTAQQFVILLSTVKSTLCEHLSRHLREMCYLY